MSAPQNVARAQEFFRGMGINVVTGSRYIGGFIGESISEKSWLAGKVEGWEESIETLMGVSSKHLKSAYARTQKSIQQEW